MTRGPKPLPLSPLNPGLFRRCRPRLRPCEQDVLDFPFSSVKRNGIITQTRQNLACDQYYQICVQISQSHGQSARGKGGEVTHREMVKDNRCPRRVKLVDSVHPRSLVRNNSQKISNDELPHSGPLPSYPHFIAK